MTDAERIADLKTMLADAQKKLAGAERERDRWLAEKCEVAAKLAEAERGHERERKVWDNAAQRAVREQERIADALLTDARRMLDELAKKYGVTLIDERAALAGEGVDRG